MKLKDSMGSTASNAMAILAVCLASACLIAPVCAQEPLERRLQDWFAGQGYDDALRIQQINVFGDGNAANGTEDDRIGMSSSHWNSSSRRPWNMGAGTIHCDGEIRGSAMIVDTREFAQDDENMIVVTSAHVLYDLQQKQRFSSCRFHYMALDHIPGYQADIDFGRSRIGKFDPSSARNNLLFGKEDWAFLFVSGPVTGISGSGRIRLRSFSSTISAPGAPVHYQFIAYSPSADSIVISTGCEVRMSTAADIGGGGWYGQLLDNCDSEGGASGGGLVASAAGSHYLVGIRSGAHWDRDIFPQQAFPDGPPDGAEWDVQSNTNFSRAIDVELIEVLRLLLLRNSGAVKIVAVF